MIPIEQDSRFRIEREELIIEGLRHTYRLFQMSDSHMSPDSPLDSEELRDKAAKHRDIWMAHGNGLTQEENFFTLGEAGKKHGADCFVLCGDMTDFPSKGTATEAVPLYESLGHYLYVLGNHETGKDVYPFYEASTNGSPAFQVMELGELTLVGVDNAAHTVSSEVLDKLEDILHGDKPVILAHHTPLDTVTLRPDAVAYWQDVSYFLFADAGRDANAERYIRLLSREHTQLKAILAGHLHFSHKDILENGVPQYVSAPALAGYGRLLTVKGTAE